MLLWEFCIAFEANFEDISLVSNGTEWSDLLFLGVLPIGEEGSEVFWKVGELS